MNSIKIDSNSRSIRSAVDYIKDVMDIILTSGTWPETLEFQQEEGSTDITIYIRMNTKSSSGREAYYRLRGLAREKALYFFEPDDQQTIKIRV